MVSTLEVSTFLSPSMFKPISSHCTCIATLPNPNPSVTLHLSPKHETRLHITTPTKPHFILENLRRSRRGYQHPSISWLLIRETKQTKKKTTRRLSSCFYLIFLHTNLDNETNISQIHTRSFAALNSRYGEKANQTRLRY